MRNRFQFSVIAIGVIVAACLSPSSAWAAGSKAVVYFYNQPDSAAPVSVTIKGKATVDVQPIAPGHVSAAVSLPEGAVPAMYSSPAMKKALQGSGMKPPRQLDLTFRSNGGSTKLGLPLQASLLDKGHVRALVYFLRVAKSGAAPSPVDQAAVAIYVSDYKAAAQGKAPVAIMNETGTERLKLEGSARFDVLFRNPDGSGWDEQSNTGMGLVTPEVMKPGRYDLVNWPAGQDTMSLKEMKQAKPIGTLTRHDIRPGHIVIYLIRRPGRLTRVLDLTPQ